MDEVQKSSDSDRENVLKGHVEVTWPLHIQ
jgi:hypothetical protein